MEIFKVGDLYHVGISVRNASDTAKLYQKTLGLIVEHDETVLDQGVRAIMLVPEDSSSSAIFFLYVKPLSVNVFFIISDSDNKILLDLWKVVDGRSNDLNASSIVYFFVFNSEFNTL